MFSHLLIACLVVPICSASASCDIPFSFLNLKIFSPKLIVVIGIYLGFKREFSKLIGFLVVALIAVGLVFNAGGVKDVLLELFNKIIGA